MAKTKAEFLKEAKALGLELNAKSTIAEIQEAIKNSSEQRDASNEKAPDSEIEIQDSSSEEPKAQAKAGKTTLRWLNGPRQTTFSSESEHAEATERRLKLH